MSADKRIPVTEKRWNELHDLKKAGQTYDELLDELIEVYQRQQLAAKARAVRDADREELVDLDEL